MSVPEVEQLRLLAQVDELVERLRCWAESVSLWEPMNQCRALVRRLLARVETLRFRLESPLLVATFGGTGTGKSALVNALVGHECTTAGRERPTTTTPVLIVHPDTDAEILGLSLDEFEIRRVDSPILRDIVVIDCPDPDTSETDSAGTNLGILRRLIPHCDVLIYTSTRQKYRSARVVEELGEASTGCRLLFVQTHAEIDEDIRDDWRGQLSGVYEVPDMFFVDSERAIREQQAGQRPSGDFARLQDLLTTQLAAAQRVRVRRANLVELIHSTLQVCRSQLDRNHPAVEQLRTVLDEQRRLLTEDLAGQLRAELLESHNLWERRLVETVTNKWGFSPFSSVLRFYNGIGACIASFTLFRARSSAQMALIGAVQGTRWFQSRSKEKEAERNLERMGGFGLSDSRLHETQIVVSGYVKSAKLDNSLCGTASLEHLRNQAADMEDRFLGNARRRVDEIIDSLAERNSGRFTRMLYEFLFLLYLGFVLFRVGKNFFYDTFLRSFFETTTQPSELLTIDFYLPAGIFFLLWSGFLVMLFTRRLRRGLHRRVEQLAQEMAEGRLSQGLFPQIESACETTEQDCNTLEAIAASTARFRRHIAESGGELGGRQVSISRKPSAAQNA